MSSTEAAAAITKLQALSEERANKVISLMIPYDQLRRELGLDR